ncbi:MAG TPA: SOS response-associated peptidase [Pyrinomonadaceae bacterium]|nr:SOS response-associated peptidase [Pyrinomonadaceae bacterium]
MCGRFTLRHPRRVRAWGVPSPDVFEINPRFNIAPSQKVLTVTESREGRELSLFDWGLIPRWSKEPAGIINARAETLEDKPSFSDSFQHRRCLIPADGFYEWKKRGKERLPYYFQLKDGSVFAFAGIWDEWKGPGGKILSCAIVTTTPNELLSTIHDRMPVMLQPESHNAWLDFRTPVPELKRLLNPYPAEEMKGYPVSNAVNHAAVEDEHLIEPVPEVPESQPSLF